VFDGAGWQSQRVVASYAQSSDLYMNALTQIRMPRWSIGRVVVTGDAAWCVTLLGGGGTSIALTGGYVLAAALSRAGDDVAAAFEDYEQWMRPVVEKVQDLPKGTPDLFYPRSLAGVRALRLVQGVLSARPLRRIGARFAHVAQTDQVLPDLAVAG
jgi:2-polyprenyl-6-methoxyphenol hydroxylase-like FAD-dependent oxidoreductase